MDGYSVLFQSFSESYLQLGSTYVLLNDQNAIRLRASNGVYIEGGNLSMGAGATVDGVDISDGVVLKNGTNVLTAGSTIDAKLGKVMVRFGPSFVNAGSPPVMDDGELLLCPCSGDSNYYFVHRSGANYFYSLAYANALA